MRFLPFIFSFFFLVKITLAQDSQKVVLNLSMDEVIELAREQSQLAVMARHSLLANYWQYRSYRAQYLPSLNLSASLGQYNRSLVALQNSQTGEFDYVQNHNLQNSLELSVNQKIELTGGQFSILTKLNRLDQFSPISNKIYNSQPINITYLQPINSFNTLKWDKIVEPKYFEKAKREYIESMESIGIVAVNLFFNVISAKNDLDIANDNLISTKKQLDIAEQRYAIGTISNNDLLSLRLRYHNSQLEIGDKELLYDMAMLKMTSFLGFRGDVHLNLEIPKEIPFVMLSFDEVVEKSFKNSSFMLERELNELSARADVKRAESSHGVQASIFARFGLNQKGESLSEAYSNLMDQEIIGLSLSVPILDWGLSRGKIKLAKSREEVIKTQNEKTVMEYEQDILIKVLQFNKLYRQIELSKEAGNISEQRYRIADERFRNGALSVIELNTAQSEMNSAKAREISDIANFWINYFNIQRLSLFNFIENRDVRYNIESITNY